MRLGPAPPRLCPLTEAKVSLSRRLDGRAPGEPKFSTAAKHAARIEFLGAQVSSMVTKVLQSVSPEALKSFRLRDLRRTCKTKMATLKIYRGVREYLQSHGLSAQRTAADVSRQSANLRWDTGLSPAWCEDRLRVG